MNPEIQGFINAARSAADDAKALFGGLSERQLNWKPNAESWSVGQCLNHLIVTNELEFPAIEAALKNGYRNPFWGRIGFLPGYFGKMVLTAVQPENPKKWKAPKIFRPTQSAVSADIVNEFVANQQKTISLMQASENLDLTKTIIVSPISSFVTYSLFDTYKILITHERRHFRQAQNVMQLPEFPKS